MYVDWFFHVDLDFLIIHIQVILDCIMDILLYETLSLLKFY